MSNPPVVIISLNRSPFSSFATDIAALSGAQPPPIKVSRYYDFTCRNMSGIWAVTHIPIGGSYAFRVDASGRLHPLPDTYMIIRLPQASLHMRLDTSKDIQLYLPDMEIERIEFDLF